MPLLEIPGRVGEFDEAWRTATVIVFLLHRGENWLSMICWRLRLRIDQLPSQLS